MDHYLGVLRRVVDAAEAVAEGTAPPRHVVDAAHAAETALDNAHPQLKALIRALFLDVDAASDAWPPHENTDQQRAAVVAAAAEYVATLRERLKDER